MSAPMSEKPVSAALQKADDGKSKGTSAGGTAHGENGSSATARYGREKDIIFPSCGFALANPHPQAIRCWEKNEIAVGC